MLKVKEELTLKPGFTRNNIIKSQERVIVISTAHGLKFTSFKLHYHEDGLNEVVAQHANPPVLLPPDIELVRETLARRLAL